MDAYETAFINDFFENNIYNDTKNDPGGVMQSGLNLHKLIDFIVRNLHFSSHGFYPGFGDLLFNAIASDPKVNHQLWLVSLLLRNATLAIIDSSYL